MGRSTKKIKYRTCFMSPKNLYDWRHELSMTQTEAANALDISLKAYQEMEQGMSYDTRRPRFVDRRTQLACESIRFAETFDTKRLMKAVHG